MRVETLKNDIIRPVLLHVKMHSMAAENLLIGTAAVESNFGQYFRQLGKGPGRGVYQIEPATHNSIWDDYLAFRPDIASIVRGVASQHYFNRHSHQELIYNIAYATVIARLVYWREPEALPHHQDIPGLAAYWKRHFNTFKGAGTEDKFIDKYPVGK